MSPVNHFVLKGLLIFEYSMHQFLIVERRSSFINSKKVV